MYDNSYVFSLHDIHCNLMCISFVAACTENSVRLMLGDGIEFYRRVEHKQAVFYNDTLSRGRVEVCRGGKFRAICADSGQMWDNRDAMVICRELGLSPYGKPTK